jgi:hypothetical protein
MELLGDEAQVEACLSLFGDSAYLTHDKYTVCAEHTISLRNHFGRTRWNS